MTTDLIPHLRLTSALLLILMLPVACNGDDIDPPTPTPRAALVPAVTELAGSPPTAPPASPVATPTPAEIEDP